MNGRKEAFTLIELIFVIVILGILTAVAIPKLTPVISDAYLAKAQAKVGSIRTGLKNYRSKALLKGVWTGQYPDLNTTPLFKSLNIPVVEGTGKGQWYYKASTGKYIYNLGDKKITFDYNKSTGSFDCESPADICDKF